MAEIKAAVGDVSGKRGFLYDSGEDKPFTAGKFAMPTAMIEALAKMAEAMKAVLN